MADVTSSLYSVISLSGGGGGGGGTGIRVGIVTNGSSFPTARPDGSPLQSGDYVAVSNSSTFPFTIGNCTFNSSRDKGVYTGSKWEVEAGVAQDTDETPVSNKAQESLSGTADYQNKVNKEFKERFEDIADEETITLNADDKVEVKDLGLDFTKVKDAAIGTGLEKSTDGTEIKHKNDITAGDNDVTFTANTVTFKKVTYDTEGHIDSNTTGKAITFDNNSDLKSDTTGKVQHVDTITAGDIGITLGTNTIKTKKVTVNSTGHTTAQADDKTITFRNGIKSDTSGYVEHTNAITAGDNDITFGTNTVTHKKLTYDAQGHISANATGKVITFKNGIKSDTSGNVEHTNSITAGNDDITLSTNSVAFKKLGYDAQGHIISNASGKTLTFKNGIKSDTSGNVEHSNAVTAGTAQATVAANSYKPKKITYDAQGHITATADDVALTFKNGVKSSTAGVVEHTNAITAGTHQAVVQTQSSAKTTAGGVLTFKKHTYDAQGHTNTADANDSTVTFADGLSLYGNKVQHTNAITAQTTAKVFKTTLDAQGHHKGTQTGYDVQTSIRASGSAVDTALPTEKAVRTEAEAIKAAFNPPKDTFDIFFDDGQVGRYDFLTTLDTNVFEITFDDGSSADYEFKGA